ncbi:MAG: penicillin-binding protein 2 [Oligoflexales bacterium]|nr:penicillin-binding protein 2 [Oligoflexales bacterium]
MSGIRPHRKLIIPERRFAWAQGIILLCFFALGTRLWYIQIFRSEYFKNASLYNYIRKIEIPAARGLIYDRNGQLLLGNRISASLIVIPQFIQNRDQLFEDLSRLLNTPVDHFHTAFKRNQGQPIFLPIILKRDLSPQDIAKVQSNLLLLPGVDVQSLPVRDYRLQGFAHLFGYLTEIDAKQLAEKNSAKGKEDYWPGDLIGRHGIEEKLEKSLRGKRGHNYLQVDALGRQTHSEALSEVSFKNKQALPGHDVSLTIDLELQTAAHDAFKGKNGAVVVLDPRSGEVMAVVSEPQFDLDIFQKGMNHRTWQNLISNPNKPLLDKSTGGLYPPGSIYKALVALAALEEKIINEKSKFYCNGQFKLGSQSFHCHQRSGHGLVDLHDALKFSCDIYFYNVGLELKVDKLAKYAKEFGLETKLGLDLNMEKVGLVPTSSWKKKTYNLPWSPGEMLPVVIGQGFNTMSPLHMATLYAAISNGGFIWQPYIVKSIIDHTGRLVKEFEKKLIKKTSMVSPENFAIVRKALASVVRDPNGTGHRSYVEGHEIAGKTGTVQIVNLGKFKSHEDVSSLWREHAIFAAFSPVENAEIVVLVMSEHDKAGGGGKAAAPVAQKIFAKYYELKQSRAKKQIQQVKNLTIRKSSH